MISPRQIKAARMLMGWRQRDLVAMSGVAIAALGRIERNEVTPHLSTLQRLRAAFERGDDLGRIEFIGSDGEKGEGVRLVLPEATGSGAAGLPRSPRP